MASPDQAYVEVSVLSGHAPTLELRFALGVPTAPMSVGTAGQWAVQADRVSPVHLFLAFDGQNIHVAAAGPDLPVLLAGRSVGKEWALAPMPCELRFGGACMIMRRATPSAPPVDAAPMTVSDGGALQQAARRAIQAALNTPNPAPGAPVFGRDGREVIEVRGLTSTVPINPSGARMAVPPAWQPAQGDAMGQKNAIAAPRRQDPPAAAPPVEEPPETLRKPGYGQYWRDASTVKKITLVLMPFALFFSYLMLVDDPKPPPRVLGPTSTASAHRSPDVGPSSVANAGVAPSDAGRTGEPDAAGDTVAGHTPMIAPAAVLVAAPFLPITKPSATPQAAPQPVPQVAQLKAGGKRTPERAALDAVAGGAFGDAARDYDALAALHPDDPSLKEAARILRQKSGYTH